MGEGVGFFMSLYEWNTCFIATNILTCNCFSSFTEMILHHVPHHNSKTRALEGSHSPNKRVLNAFCPCQRQTYWPGCVWHWWGSTPQAHWGKGCWVTPHAGQWSAAGRPARCPCCSSPGCSGSPRCEQRPHSSCTKLRTRVSLMQTTKHIQYKKVCPLNTTYYISPLTLQWVHESMSYPTLHNISMIYFGCQHFTQPTEIVRTFRVVML